MLDVRSQFPLFASGGQVKAYLDSAASAQKPACVLEAMDCFLRRDYANTHRGVHSLTQGATVAYEAARASVATFLNAPEGATTVITKGTTHAINMVAATWGRTNVKKGDRIVLTTYEHHSNFLPWVALANEVGAVIDVIGLAEDGSLDMESAKAIFAKGDVKLLAVAHVSNVLGSVSDLDSLVQMAHQSGAKVLVDGAQAVAHMGVDLSAMGADFYAFSAHKLYGPTGVGALIIAPGLAEEMPPYEFGGGMVHVVDLENPSWAPAPYKFEAGTPPIVEAVGMHVAIDFVSTIGLDAICEHEQELLKLLDAKLAELDFVKRYRSPAGSIGVVSMNVDGVHPHDVGTILDQAGVAVRVGHHCAQPLMKHFGVDAMVRASLGIYNNAEDIELLVESLKKSHKIFA